LHLLLLASLFFLVQMAIQQAQPLTSIYMTFKIFQLINHFRRRLKPRVQSDRTKPDTSLGPKTRLGLENDAFRGLEKCLPVRVSGLEGSKYRNAHDRVRKARKGSRLSLKPLPLGRDGSGPPNTSKERVQRYVRVLLCLVSSWSYAKRCIASYRTLTESSVLRRMH